MRTHFLHSDDIRNFMEMFYMSTYYTFEELLAFWFVFFCACVRVCVKQEHANKWNSMTCLWSLYVCNLHNNLYSYEKNQFNSKITNFNAACACARWWIDWFMFKEFWISIVPLSFFLLLFYMKIPEICTYMWKIFLNKPDIFLENF